MEDIDGLPLDPLTARVLERLLRDFGPTTDVDVVGGDQGRFDAFRVNEALPLIQPARLALMRAGFRMRRGHDKTAWEMDGAFRGVEITLADTLYGPRLWVSKDFDGDTAGFALEAAASLARAGAFIEKKVLTPHARAQADAGNVTLLNTAGRLHGGYQFFRWHAEGLVDGHGDMKLRKELIQFAQQAAGVENLGPGFIPSNVGFCVAAMTTAWFSWLEHILVLMLPFGSWDPADATVQHVIGESWSGKWRRVVGIDTKESKEIFDSLSQTAEQYRNRDAHGGFGKRDAALLIHAPGGPMPARLTAGIDHILGAALPSSDVGLQDVIAALDRAEEFLRTGPTRYAMQWIDGGLDVAFDARTRADIHAAMAAGDSDYEQALDRWAQAQDRANNYEF